MEENGFERKAFETQSAFVVAQSPMEGAACRKDDIDSQISGNLPEEIATKSPKLTTKKRRRRKKRCWDFKNERNRKRGTVPRKTTPVASTSSKTAPVAPTCRRTTLPTPLEDKWQSHKLLQPTVKIEPLKMELIKQEKELQQETDTTSQNTDAEDEWQRKLISYIIGGGASFTNTPVKTTSEVPPVDRTTVFTCFKCGLQFHQRFRLQAHLKWHERTIMKSILYTCENCGLHYKQLSCLKSHIALVHVSRWVSKRASRGRNRGRPSFGHRPKEENRRQCEESREEIYEDHGVMGKQGDEEADQENYLRLTVEGSDQKNYLHERENYLHHTVEENDRGRSSQRLGEESNKKSDHHQQSTDEEIANNHIGGLNNLDHEYMDVGNDQPHAESEAEIGLENDEEHDRHHEDTINEETDEICEEDVDYIIEQNDQSSEDDEQADEGNDECFGDENRDDGGSILTFKSTDQLGCDETNYQTTASITAEVDPQPIERRSTRLSNMCRSQRMSSNTTVDQIRRHGDDQQSKESPGYHGNRGRKRSHGEQSAERKNVRKKCGELICPDCGLKCTHKADLLRHKCAEKVLHCQVCRRQYASHQDLLKHVSEEHVVSLPSTDENGDDQIETHRVEVRQHGIMKETPETPSAVVYGEKNDYLSITEALNILQQPNIGKISFTTAVSPQPGQMFLYSDEVNVQWRKDGHKWEHCGKHKVPKARPGCWKAYYREKLPAGGMSSFFRHVFTAFETDNKLTLVHYVLNDQKILRLVVDNEKQVLGNLSEERATKKQRQQKKGCLGKKKRNWKRHVLRSVTDDFHADASEIPTDICSQAITAENSSDQPEVRCTSLKPFKCRMCANAFASQHDLQNHEVVHSKEKPVSKPLQCRTCHKAFSTAQSLRIHSKRHVNSRNSVRQKSERKLLEELNSTMSLNCCECDKIFKTSGNLRRHVLLHNVRRLQHACRAADGECAFLMFKDYVKKFRGYGCHLCEKAFLWPGQLRVHVMVHTGEKLYHCSQCEAGFLYGGNFRQHMRTHTGEKPHCCDVCGKRFAQSSNLKAHRTMHMNEKPFKCNDCSKEFRRLSQLKSHQELYQKDKYMYRVHQERILNARKMHELTEKATAEGGEKELLNRTDEDGPSIVEQYDYDTEEEQE